MMIARTLVCVAGLLACIHAAAFTPQTGHWYNPNESGSGYNIDIQDGTLVMTVFSFKASGDSEWYISSGALTSGGHSFTGSLQKARNGQCAGCPYVKPTDGGSDGPVAINFLTEQTATITLGGRTTTIQRFNFGWGDVPTGLLGEWVYVEQIGTPSFADRYNYTHLSTAPSANVGATLMVVDDSRIAGCEGYTSGPNVGTVLCADANAAGILENIHRYVFGFDETFSGFWVSPISGSSYSMKGHKVTSHAGYAKIYLSGDATDPLAATKGLAERGHPKALDDARTIDLNAVEALAIALREELGLPR